MTQPEAAGRWAAGCRLPMPCIRPGTSHGKSNGTRYRSLGGGGGGRRARHARDARPRAAAVRAAHPMGRTAADEGQGVVQVASANATEGLLAVLLDAPGVGLGILEPARAVRQRCLCLCASLPSLSLPSLSLPSLPSLPLPALEWQRAWISARRSTGQRSTASLLAHFSCTVRRQSTPQPTHTHTHTHTPAVLETPRGKRERREEGSGWQPHGMA